MAVTIGVNSGFVSTAPTSNPDGFTLSMNDKALVTKDTSPATAIKITEIGWWCDSATDEANFEIGLYAADGAVVPNEAGTRLFVDTTNAKGTTTGWKTVAVDWDISELTDYWIGISGDAGSTTNANRNISSGSGYDRILSQSTLPNPFGGGSLDDSDGSLAIYALWSDGEATGTNMQINIGDSFKDVDALKINIGDVWKDVVSVKQNIGDAWKDVF